MGQVYRSEVVLSTEYMQSEKYVGERCQGEGPRAMEGAKPHFHVVQSHTKVGTLPSDAWSKNRRYLNDPRSY